MLHLKEKKVLLIIGGGIAACKTPDLIRRFRDYGAQVQCIMTKAACEFISPLSIKALSGHTVFTELFDPNTKEDISHIRLSRQSDMIVVAPTTANLMAKMSHGYVDDLASSLLLAANKPILIAPAMNPKMWLHPATQRNRKTLENDGVFFVGPAIGEMAESGEAGEGRMSEPAEIISAAHAVLASKEKPLKNRKIIVTSGSTHEPIDPVRYIGNRSSGKQGHAIAQALSLLGAQVYLVSGPVSLNDPRDVNVIRVKTARDMYEKVMSLLPADAAIFVAAVADWRLECENPQKIKKQKGIAPPVFKMVENPDILSTVAHHENRPELVIGFAGETENLEKNARQKLLAKGADFMIANDISYKSTIVGGDENQVSLICDSFCEQWPRMSKEKTAWKLAELIEKYLNKKIKTKQSSCLA